MKCDGCKFWSEMVAEASGCGEIVAYCLSPLSWRRGKMVSSGCAFREAGDPVDLPQRAVTLPGKEAE